MIGKSAEDRSCEDAGRGCACASQQTSLRYHDVIQSIVSALEARDPHTAEHSLRVGDMVEATCTLMDLPEETCATIHMAAHVHDIGKIGIPDRLLLKKARLTAAEHNQLRTHPVIGYDILKGCESLREVADIVLHHHERWDGTGYPCGLSGQEIPLGARIVSVCDAIDAMLGKRLYSKSMTQRECVQEVFLGSGTMFDPQVAWFVLKHWDAIVGPIEFRDVAEGEPVAYRGLHCDVTRTYASALIA